MEGELQTVVGENIRRLRREGGFSQEGFGAHIGWHRTFVGAVERGERNLTLKTVERLSQQLGVHPFELLWDRSGVAVVLEQGAVLSLEPGVAGQTDGAAATLKATRKLRSGTRSR